MSRRPTALVLWAALALLAPACAAGDTAADAADAADDANSAGGAGDAPEGGEPGQDPAGEPIVVGSTLSLTGPLAPTATIHKVAGELFVERLNAAGGLLGRPVEWRVLDDESLPDRSAGLYERLITEEQVDLVMAPYGTGATTAAMAIVERHGYVFPQHTGSLTYAYDYDCQFPTWATGRNPNETTPTTLFEALAASGAEPETVAFVTNQFPGTMFVSYGEPDTDDVGAVGLAAERGYEVVLDIQFPTNISDWGPIAAQVRDADADLVYLGGIGLDAPNLLTALQQLDYRPEQLFVTWPAPGPLLQLGETGEGVLSMTLFEPNAPQASDPQVREVVEAFEEASREAGLPYTGLETQAAASWTAWETLVAGVEGAGTIDHDAICAHLLEAGVDSTMLGQIAFDPEQNNYYGDLQAIKQVQDGAWVIVHPEETASAPLHTP